MSWPMAVYILIGTGFSGAHELAHPGLVSWYQGVALILVWPIFLGRYLYMLSPLVNP